MWARILVVWGNQRVSILRFKWYYWYYISLSNILIAGFIDRSPILEQRDWPRVEMVNLRDKLRLFHTSHDVFVIIIILFGGRVFFVFTKIIRCVIVSVGASEWPSNKMALLAVVETRFFWCLRFVDEPDQHYLLLP